jgi:membrane protein DedA with SNARE-associated domain
VALGSLIATHGYWILAAGCLLEGESALLLAGLAAHAGYLNPFAVLTIAALAGFAGDQFYFWLGRRQGAGVLARWPSIAAQAGRVCRLIERYPAGIAIAVRFAYGLRIAGPILIGMSRMRALQFAVLNALGALVWAVTIGGAGWLFGTMAKIDVRLLMGVLIVLGAAAIGLKRGRAPRA